MMKQFSTRRVLCVLGAYICVAGTSALAADPDLDKADVLMKQGKPAEAYSLLEPYEFQLSGDIKFDYLLGIAALDSGKPDKATLAFERVLAVDPNFAGARIDMARAYFQLGDLTRAKAEFETVLTQNPPAAARATIDNYLTAIAKQEDAKKTRVSGYVEGFMGRDNNVNFATSQNQIAVPALGNLIFTLNPSSVKSPDSYRGIAFGGEISHQITSELGVYAGADVRKRSNISLDTFDSTSIDARAGVSMGEGRNLFRLGVLGGRYDLDGRSNRESDGVSAEWRHTLDTATQFSTFGQYARFRFEPTIGNNNFDQAMGGVNLLRILRDGKALVTSTILTGNERAPLRADGGKRFNGLRLGGQYQLGENSDLFGGLGVQYSKFDLANAAFSSASEARTRTDMMYDANIGVNWRFDKDWTLRPQISYLRNYSNIIIYKHDRTDVSLTIRRDFK